jgi:sulfotransferase family protein
MSRGPDFIGIGAQRTGTSWMYACLFEHPGICMPRKEINFFSRDRNWSRSFGWYEEIFAECPADRVSGEFSTSYLTAPKAAARIRERYPDARLIVSLRHPVDRAYSSYLNDIVAGAVPPTKGFREALEANPGYLDGGRYARHLQRYLDLFPRERLHVSLFDEARIDPLAAMREVYGFLGVDPSFRPAMLDRPVGRGRVPRVQAMDRVLQGTAGAFRSRRSLRRIWWVAKRVGVGDRLRALNTRRGADSTNGLDRAERERLVREFDSDVSALEDLLHVELPGWRR